MSARTFFLFLLLALGVAGMTEKKQDPKIVILCEDGGVYRPLEPADGFAMSGKNCVLAEKSNIAGKTVHVDYMQCYDSSKAAP